MKNGRVAVKIFGPIGADALGTLVRELNSAVKKLDESLEAVKLPAKVHGHGQREPIMALESIPLPPEQDDKK